MEYTISSDNQGYVSSDLCVRLLRYSVSLFVQCTALETVLTEFEPKARDENKQYLEVSMGIYIIVIIEYI